MEYFLDILPYIVIFIMNLLLKGQFNTMFHYFNGCGAGGAEYRYAYADTGHSKIFYAEFNPFPIVINLQTLKRYDRNLNPSPQ